MQVEIRGGDGKCFAVEVHERAFRVNLVDWGRKFLPHYTGGLIDCTAEISRHFGEIYSSQGSPTGDDITFFRPFVELARGRGWLAIRIAREDWYFFFEEPAGLLECPLCEEMSVDAWGNIRVGSVTYQAFVGTWPIMVSQPGPYVARGLLLELLETSDENPLTILERSPWPYKGLAKQLRAKIASIGSWLPEK